MRPWPFCLLTDRAGVCFIRMERNRERRWLPTEGILFLLLLALYGGATHPRVFTAGNDASRWALIESLVDLGRTDISGSRFGWTVDRVVLPDGRELSNKPPLLALLGAGIYWLLQQGFGWSLSGRGAGEVVRWTTILLVGLPAALLATRLAGALRGLGETSPKRARLLAIGLACGTTIGSYAVTFNAHVAAAWLLLVAWMAVREGRAASAGLAASVAGAFDLLPGFGMLPFLGWTLWQNSPEGVRSRALLRFAGGGSVGIALLSASNLWISGSPWPPKWLPGAVDLSARAGPSVLGVVLPEGWSYPFEILLGGHGLLTVSPILFVALAGWARKLRASPAPERSGFWVPLGCGILSQFLGHAVLAGSYGGWSYGYRYLLPVVPLLLLALAGELQGGLKRLFLLLLPISALFTVLGAYHPWPPAYEQGATGHPVAMRVTNPVGGNLAAFLARHFPNSQLEKWVGGRFVSGDRRERIEYYRLFFGSRGDLRGMREFT